MKLAAPRWRCRIQRHTLRYRAAKSRLNCKNQGFSEINALALDWPEYLNLLLLIVLANAAPLFAWLLLGDRFAFPVDAGRTLWDGQPVLGASKTVRGVFSACLICTLAAPVLGLPWAVGAMVGLAAMGGDMLSSFVKRRLRQPPGTPFVLLDQVPESLFPALAVGHELQLTGLEIVAVVGLFGVLHLALTLSYKATQR